MMNNILLKLMFNTLPPQKKQNKNKKKTRTSHGLTIFTERKMLEKVEKIVTNLHDKNEYVIHIKNIKQALYHGLILKKVDRVLNLIKKIG